MIRPEKKTIEEILKSSSHKFSVPKYQRGFDWGKNELRELFDDLKEVQKTGRRDLFLGNFIFDISDEKNFKIVDGQQRLTMISLVLIGLREHAKKIKEAGFAGELQNLIAANSAWSDEVGNKVSVSENIKKVFDYISDREWDGKFPDKVDERSVKRQVNKIKPIYNFITGEIKTYKKKELQDFTKALLYAYVIVIEVDSDEDVFSIFERTNARGLDLNIGDLLKNRIFSYQEGVLEEKWDEVVQNAETSLPRMLKYFWVSRRGYILQSELYKKLRDYVEELGVNEFVDELYEFSRYYEMANSNDSEKVRSWLEENDLNQLSSNEDYYRRISRVLQALKLFRVTQAYPVIFSIFKRYKKEKGKNSYKALLDVLHGIENFHFVNNVVSGRIGNEVEKLYAEQAQKFYNGKGGFRDHVNDFLKELRNRKALQDEFVSNFIENVTYDNIALVNYVYDRINNYGAKGAQWVEIFNPEKDLKKRNYNIEHFLAQNLVRETDNDEDIESLHKIGNLLIIPRHTNSELKDAEPCKKLELIRSDPKHFGNLRYLQEFVSKYGKYCTSWDHQIIQKRSQSLALNGYLHVWDF